MRSAGSLELRSVFFGFLDVSSFPLSPPRPRKTHALAQSDLTQMHPIGFLSSFYWVRCQVSLHSTRCAAAAYTYSSAARARVVDGGGMAADIDSVTVHIGPRTSSGRARPLSLQRRLSLASAIIIRLGRFMEV